MATSTFYPTLSNTLVQWAGKEISAERKEILQVLIDYINEKRAKGEALHLNFICTHNSRRSQFSQIWAKTAADFHGIPAHTYSGGVEVTAFNERAVASIERAGFQVSSEGEGNPIYKVSAGEETAPMVAFSKVYDNEVNPDQGFATIMTCSHADENCPFIPGAEKRIPLRYEDPKAFDNSPEEAAKYDERSAQIANELFYVFSQVKK
ncbi:protein-tyrosine-phosphatase [Persicobacter diffluens]|uniref:Arsenate reductase n=1 Tax=Persicobacter diffluens TaxID=981 RepID=A0AAN5ANI4_9BACT|nr:arsenate reductase [Persicobacter diffluens]